MDFCYGSRDGLLWPILNKIFNLNLTFETTEHAVRERQNFLTKRQIGICDMVASAKREKIDASDLGMKDIQLRDLIHILLKFPSITTLLFTGGNSKNGPEYFFRKLAKEYLISLRPVVNEVPRIHEFVLPGTHRLITTVSLTAPSGAANRAVGSMETYKLLKSQHPEITSFDFRVLQYQRFF